VRVEFDGEIIYWRGPSPFYFVEVPDDESAEIHAVAAQVTYGWGVIPATVELGATRWTTSLFPRGDLYMVPLKAHVRGAEKLDLGDAVHVALELEVGY
jgi:hypothetical protein